VVIGVERQGALSVLISSSGAPSDHHKINISTAIQRIIYAGRTREREIKNTPRASAWRENLNIYGRCRKISTQHTPRGEFYGPSAREPRERVFDLLFYLGRAAVAEIRPSHYLCPRASSFCAQHHALQAWPTLFAAPH
jgi:hypothetical protein